MSGSKATNIITKRGLESRTKMQDILKLGMDTHMEMTHIKQGKT